MRPRYRIRSRDDERYLDALDEARDNLRIARREYHEALDELEELEASDPRDDEHYRPRRRVR